MAKTSYAPEELTREAYKLLAREKARVGGLNYAPYRGPSVAPMSSLTERARTLQEQFAAKPAPYSGKIQSVLSRENQGITPANVQELLGQLQGAQRGFTQGPILSQLRNEFRSAIEPRIGEFTGRTESDIGRYLPEAQGTLENLAKVSGGLESSRSRQTARTFQNLQAEVESRWNLVETAWELNVSRSLLTVNHDASQNQLYVFDRSNRRRNVTSSRGALNGYQKGKCFYCRCNINVDLFVVVFLNFKISLVAFASAKKNKTLISLLFTLAI